MTTENILRGHSFLNQYWHLSCLRSDDPPSLLWGLLTSPRPAERGREGGELPCADKQCTTLARGAGNRAALTCTAPGHTARSLYAASGRRAWPYTIFLNPSNMRMPPAQAQGRLWDADRDEHGYVGGAVARAPGRQNQGVSMSRRYTQVIAA